jgi:hypothetical protein
MLWKKTLHLLWFQQVPKNASLVAKMLEQWIPLEKRELLG